MNNKNTKKSNNKFEKDQFSNGNLPLTELTEEEIHIIKGTLLGDSHVNKRGNSYRIKISHKREHEDLVDWKYYKLKRLCSTTKPPSFYKRKKGFESKEFYTSSSMLFKPIHSLFYKWDGEKFVKRITPELIDQLSPLLLAVWYMDDGSARKEAYCGKIATQSFTKEENELLQEYLNRMGISTNVVFHSKEKNLYNLHIPAKSFPIFVNKIEPYVKEVPALIYKLNESRRESSKYGRETP